MTRTRSALVALALALGAATLVSGPATAADYVLDQSAGGPEVHICTQVGGRSVAQTFTAGKSGPLVRVDLDISNPNGQTTPTTVQIEPVDGNGRPDDTTLATATATSAQGVGWVTFTFDTPAQVHTGTQYAIVATAAVGVRFWCHTDDDPYAGGKTYIRAQDLYGNLNWNNPSAPTDSAFRTYVGLAAQTIDFAGVPALSPTSPNTALSASASSGLPVTFTSQTPEVCTVVDDTKVHPVATGLCTIAADQPGDDATYAAAPQVTRSTTIDKILQTITFANPGPQRFGTDLTVTATSSSGLPIDFFAFGGAVSCNVTPSGVVTFIGLGTCEIAAHQAGNAGYREDALIRSFQVLKGQVTLTAGPATQVYGATTQPTVTPIVTGNAGALGPITCATNVSANTGVGTIPDATECGAAVDPNYELVQVFGPLTVTRAPVVVTAGPTTSPWGTTPSAPVPSYAGFKNGQTSSVLTVAPICTTGVTASSNVGTYLLSNSCAGAMASNYTFTYAKGAATVTKANLVITASPTSVFRSFFAGKMTFTAKVANASNAQPVAGVPVTFLATSVFGVKITCAGTSNAAGVATCVSKNLGFTFLRTPSTYTAKAPAATNYNAGSGSGKVTYF